MLDELDFVRDRLSKGVPWSHIAKQLHKNVDDLRRLYDWTIPAPEVSRPADDPPRYEAKNERIASLGGAPKSTTSIRFRILEQLSLSTTLTSSELFAAVHAPRNSSKVILSETKTQGLIDRGPNGRYSITAKGREALGATRARLARRAA